MGDESKLQKEIKLVGHGKARFRYKRGGSEEEYTVA